MNDSIIEMIKSFLHSFVVLVVFVAFVVLFYYEIW